MSSMGDSFGEVKMQERIEKGQTRYVCVKSVRCLAVKRAITSNVRIDKRQL